MRYVFSSLTPTFIYIFKCYDRHAHHNSYFNSPFDNLL